MKKKALITTTAAVALVAAVGIGSTLAYFTDKADTQNVVTFGHVDISIDEPNFDTEDGEEDNSISNVVPGQVIVKDPTIKVAADSQDAFLRAKISYEGLNKKQARDLEKLIAFSDNDKDGKADWVKGAKGYYYYQKRVSAKDEVKFFETVTIPYTWKNEVANHKIAINVSAEAIQAANTPMEEKLSKGEQIKEWVDPTGKSISAEQYNAPEQTSDNEETGVSDQDQPQQPVVVEPGENQPE